MTKLQKDAGGQINQKILDTPRLVRFIYDTPVNTELFGFCKLPFKEWRESFLNNHNNQERIERLQQRAEDTVKQGR